MQGASYPRAEADVDALLLRQRDLEDNCLARGAHRFRQRLEAAVRQKQQSSVGAARKLLSDHIDPTTTAIQAMIDEAHTPGREDGSTWP
jgi:hypothetical protein